MTAPTVAQWASDGTLTLHDLADLIDSDTATILQATAENSPHALFTAAMTDYLDDVLAADRTEIPPGVTLYWPKVSTTAVHTTQGDQTLQGLADAWGCQPSTVIRLTAAYSPGAAFDAGMSSYLEGVFAQSTLHVPPGTVLYYLRLAALRLECLQSGLTVVDDEHVLPPVTGPRDEHHVIRRGVRKYLPLAGDGVRDADPASVRDVQHGDVPAVPWHRGEAGEAQPIGPVLLPLHDRLPTTAVLGGGQSAAPGAQQNVLRAVAVTVEVVAAEFLLATVAEDLVCHVSSFPIPYRVART